MRNFSNMSLRPLVLPNEWDSLYGHVLPRGLYQLEAEAVIGFGDVVKVPSIHDVLADKFRELAAKIVREQEEYCEMFAMSGAFLNELCLEIRRYEMQERLPINWEEGSRLVVHAYWRMI